MGARHDGAAADGAAVAGERRARYRAVVEDQTDLIRRFTPDGRLTFVNPAFCRFYGKSEAELLGQNYIDLVYPEDREMVLQRMATICPDNPSVITEPRILRPGGEIGWIQYVNRGIFDEAGNLVEVQSVGARYHGAERGRDSR